MHHILWLFLNKNRNRTETKTWYVKRVCGKKSARALTHTRKLNDANLWRSFSWSFYCRPNTKNGLNVSLILFPIRILCCACVCVGKELNFFTFYLSNINKWNRWKRGSEFNSSQTKPKYCSFYFSLVWLPPPPSPLTLFTYHSHEMFLIHWIIKDPATWHGNGFLLWCKYFVA